ncbi:endoplasmic reticulum-Golgi intermediate compartment protein 3-like [Homarus americanus]|uniref:endoplasmic reticulum-Golgi intermediate compartment protein 3-like n=1 Tax=Homarus americanus TaxID=6706 RepID=UPI001C47F812|nr:endoplasmic reticulum-Golgi intermediate compartment protein 3-like [Homarus americanus]XP_042236904.1 endoplasmic reticulum-Golgi intermediate compartment protein 3-like [Homarus americanus]XP_042236905.1 endoplasmic reticulum-Golgi intermediate compartment protein 3-like [Homarus americanus]XP_042236906.1 endoplasmic reticulum-Golgi intermediate compartment protein 3-like [Homarus americanus]
MGSTVKSVADKLRQLDAYPKTQEDFQIKTLSGAAVAIVAGIIMALLFLSELYDYLTPKLAEDLFVDTTRGSKLRINLDVIFPNIPCNMLSLDAMDLSGEQHVNIHHNIYKRKLDLDGRPIQDPERQERIGHAVKEDVNGTQENNVVQTTAAPKCGSCYGAESEKDQCCNTCEDVKDAYRTKGWALPPLKNINQCVKEGKLVESSELPDEGCQIYGYLEVNRVGGNFHLAPGKSFQHNHLHIHDVQQYRTADFDLSHRIRHLSFGVNIPGKTNPIDGTELKTEKGPKTINYYIKIVPTTYEKVDGSTLSTNQFSVTQHQKNIQMGMGETGLPGVFFTYELSPMMVKYTEKHKSLGHFLTGVCSIIGGVFTVAGIIDSIIYHSHRALQRKIEIGKAT